MKIIMLVQQHIGLSTIYIFLQKNMIVRFNFIIYQPDDNGKKKKKRM